MKQATTGNKDIIKKLLTDSLSPEEREKLNNYKFVNQAIYSQWEQASDMYTDVDKEERMLTNVMHQIKKGKTGRFRQSLHRYGWVASIALLLICGTLSLMLLSRKAEPEVWYVLNSGRQSMDSVRLADGTLVMLNAGSRLTYPKEFSGNKREVTLSGQAFFSVHPDKAHPFVVKTKNMDVTALGTAFEVFSFDGDESVETVLLNGRGKRIAAPYSQLRWFSVVGTGRFPRTGQCLCRHPRRFLGKQRTGNTRKVQRIVCSDRTLGTFTQTHFQKQGKTKGKNGNLPFR